ncbi:hypothetical protein D3C80_631610 [compost metagenome]
MFAGRVLLAALDGLLADADIGNRHRQQDQVGEHDHRHADRSTDSQFTDHADVDDQQGDEAYGVGQNRNHPRQEQLAEGASGSGQGVISIARLQGNAVDLLHPVGNADGEDQKRHQHRIRIKAEPYRMHQPQLPDYRHQGGDQNGDGAADTPGEPVQQDPGDHQGDTEEHRHHHQAIDQVTYLFRETDDVNLHIRVLRLELVADLLFQLMGELLVIELDQFALVLRIRVRLQQRHIDDARLEVVAHQATDLAGLEHVVAQQVEAVGRTVVSVGNDFTTSKAFFGHLGPAHARAPQRLQPGAIDPRNVEDLVMNLAQGLHVVLAEDIAIGGFHRNAHGVAEVGQVVTVFEHLLDEGMLKRNHFLEAGRRTDLRGLPEQKYANQQADENHHRAVVEDQAFKQGRLVVMVLLIHVELLLLAHGCTPSAPWAEARCTPP